MADRNRWKMGPQWVNLSEAEAQAHPNYEKSGWYVVVVLLIFGSVAKSTEESYTLYLKFLNATKSGEASTDVATGFEFLLIIVIALLLVVTVWAFMNRGKYFQRLFAIVSVVEISSRVGLVLDEPEFGTISQINLAWIGSWLIYWLWVLYSRRLNVTVCHRVRADDPHLVRRFDGAFKAENIGKNI